MRGTRSGVVARHRQLAAVDRALPGLDAPAEGLDDGGKRHRPIREKVDRVDRLRCAPLYAVLDCLANRHRT